MTVVSIIMPAYNAEKTIVETIQSIQKQSFSNFEIIVINDGSSDQTLSLLNEIEDSRLKIFSYENSERAISRNHGIKHSIGEFITFIDADDLWTSDKLEDQLHALQANPSAGVAYSWTTFINEVGNVLYAGEPTYFEGDVYADLLTSNFIMSGSNILVRRHFIDITGGFDCAVIPAEDWDYSIRLAAQCPFVVVPKYQVLYRRSSWSTTSNVNFIKKGALKVVNKAFKTAPPDLKNLKSRAISNSYRFMAKLHLEFLSSKDDLKKVKKNLKKSIYYYPKILAERETQKLIVKLFLLKFLSYELGSCFIKWFSKNKLKISIQ